MKKLFILLLVALSFNTLMAQNTTTNFGIALAGAEWGMHPSSSDLDYFSSKGMKLVRMPIAWERIQPTLNGTLDPTELTKIKNFINYAKTKNIDVLIDLHNYCRRRKNPSDPQSNVIIGSPDLTLDHVKDVWMKLAMEFKGYTNIWGYGLMNEPHNMDESPLTWFTIAQELITSVRTIDKTTTIVVAGDRWSSANDWPTASGNLKNLVDPSKNLIFEAHCYFDRDGSSLSYSVSDHLKSDPQRGVKRVQPFVEWLKANKQRGFVGEYGIPANDPAWALILDNFLHYMADNCVNGTYWAAGQGWPVDYDLSVQPRNGVEKPQMKVLTKYLTTSGTCAVTPTPIGPAGYTYATTEGATVAVTGKMDVAYGANGSFVYLYNQTSSIGCTNTNFEKDPLVGVLKSCFTKPSVVLPQGPDGYTYATNEGGTVALTGTMDIAYGANGQFNYLYNQTSNIGCNNTSFNGDPLVGIFKQCYTKPSQPNNACLAASSEASNFIVRNSWADQNNGSGVTNANGAMKITHRQWGQSTLWFIGTAPSFTLTQGKHYTISFEYQDASNLESMDVGFVKEYFWNGGVDAQPKVKITGGFSNVFKKYEVTLTAANSGKVYLAFKLNWANQPNAIVNGYVKNIKICSNSTVFRIGEGEQETLLENASGVSMYPNPATADYVIVDATGSGSIPNRIQVLNAIGTVILDTDRTDEQTIVSVATLPQGTYSLKTYMAGGVAVQKLIIIK